MVTLPATAGLRYVRRLRNLLVVLVAVGVGIAFPEAAPFVQRLTLPVVAFLLYSSLAGVTVSRDRLVESVLPVLAVLCLSYAVVPFVGIYWATRHLPDGMVLGIAAILAAPATAGSAIVWTRVARGNTELSGIATLSSLLLAPVLTPLVLSTATDLTLPFPVSELQTNLLLITGVAVALVVVVPRGTLNDRLMRSLTTLSIALLIYAGVGSTGFTPDSFVAVGRVALLTIVVFTGGLLGGLLTVRTLGLTHRELVAVFFSGTLKNLGIALFIVLSTSSHVALVAVISYYVSQQLFSALLVDSLALGVDALGPAFR